VGIIGIGQAGGKILDTILAYDSEIEASPVHSALAINTAEADLLGLTHVPEKQQLLIGKGTQNGGGVGADNETGAEVTVENIETIHTALEQIPNHELDAFVIVAALVVDRQRRYASRREAYSQRL
jgi:Cell division GTPase